MLQGLNLTEDDFRGTRFANHPKPLMGCSDALVLSNPDVIQNVHEAYLEAGADAIETNSFNANRLSMAEYGLEESVREMNRAAAQVARRACDRFDSPEKPRFVFGVLGPTSKTASMSPDVNAPGYRAVLWNELFENYYEAAEGLLDGGVDAILVETVFDTLNCKAALAAVMALFEAHEREVPLMVSGTITDAAGRLLSGQTPEAFWLSISHAPLISVGFNCALARPSSDPTSRPCPKSQPPRCRPIRTRDSPTRLADTTRLQSRWRRKSAVGSKMA